MKTNTLRIILGVICIAAFAAAVLIPLFAVNGAPLGLCELISLNKVGVEAGGNITGIPMGDKAILDGAAALAVIGFTASMLLLLTSYLALIPYVDKRFAGVSGIAAGLTAAGCGIAAEAISGGVNSAVKVFRAASAGWGAYVMIALGLMIAGLAVWLLAARAPRAKRSAAIPYPAEPTRKEPPRSARYGDLSGSREDSGTAAAEFGEVGVYTSPVPSAAAGQPSGPALIIGLEGTYKDAEIDVSDGSPVNFGRDASVCQIVFDKYDTVISRRHLLVRFVPEYDMYEARDMSRNGTFIDGLSKKLPVYEAQLLPRGTVILIGSGREAFRLG